MCLFMMGWGWTTWAYNKVRLSFDNQERKDRASQMELVVKNPSANAGNVRDLGLIPGRGRSPGGGHSNTLQCSCLENLHGKRSLVGYSP